MDIEENRFVDVKEGLEKNNNKINRYESDVLRISFHVTQASPVTNFFCA